jgi:hypothetical protein
MAGVATSYTGVLLLEDGSGTPKTIEVYPQEGDVTITPGETTFVEVKHRGRPIADGEGIIGQEDGYCQVEFTVMAKDFADDDSKIDAWFRWMRKTTDTSAADVVSGGVTSTTTRDDSRATVNVLWYPHGTGSGKRYCRIPDCLLVARPITEGSPTTLSITMRSTTARDEVWATA